MHMADALLTPAVAGTMYALSAGAAGYSVHEWRKTEQPPRVPVMGVLGSFVFAAQMVNFSIPGTGASGHLCGSMLLSAVLGPEAGFLTMIGILLIQCLLFADGGLMALGANIWNMAFYGCFLGGYLVWRTIMRRGMSKKKIIAASMLGAVLTLQLGAFSVVLETLLSGITELPFSVFAAFMQPIHLAIGLAEGAITAAVLVFLYEMRPQLLWGASGMQKESRMTARALIVTVFAAAVLTGGVLSLFASSRPDGLEWSVEKSEGIADRQDSDAAENAVQRADMVSDRAQKIQDATAILPDYALPGSDTPIGTSLAGLIGGAVVLVLCAGSCYLIRERGKKKENRNYE